MPAWAQEVLYTREAEAALSGEGELHEDVLGAAEGAEATGAASASDEGGVQPLRQGLLTPGADDAEAAEASRAALLEKAWWLHHAAATSGRGGGYPKDTKVPR